MSAGWKTWLDGALVVLAIFGALSWLLWRRKRKQSGCACGGGAAACGKAPILPKGGARH